MTTIAWDGKTLAADSRCTAGGFHYEVSKICRLSDGRIYAGSGEITDYEQVKSWLDGKTSKPDTKEFQAVIVDLTGQLWRIEDKIAPFKVFSRFPAIGSGRDYAMAAMHYGRSAR